MIITYIILDDIYKMMSILTSTAPPQDQVCVQIELALGDHRVGAFGDGEPDAPIKVAR